jgi:hypothetical protein
VRRAVPRGKALPWPLGITLAITMPQPLDEPLPALVLAAAIGPGARIDSETC